MTDVTRKRLCDMTQDDALKDGFEDTEVSHDTALDKLYRTLANMHSCDYLTELDIITWRWTTLNASTEQLKHDLGRTLLQ